MKGQRVGEFEEIVMLAVRWAGRHASSVDIQEVLRSEASRSASLGAIYAAMDRLERKGLVKSWLVDPQPGQGGRQRRGYALTPAGSAALRRTRRVRDRLWNGSQASASGSGREA